VLIVGLGLMAMIAQQSMDEESIQTWAKENDCKIVSVEKTIIDKGPFWIRQKHQRIYRVQVIDRYECSKVTYFRFGFCGYDQEWYNP
jgi:hypothetical protein